MKLEIGKQYYITYHKPSTHVQHYETTLCALKEPEKHAIVEYLQTHAQSIQYKFKQRKIILAEYIRDIKRLNKMKNNKELYARKSDKMIQLETTIKTYKGVYFPKKESTEQEKSRNLFIREYDPQYLKFYKDANSDTVRVIYAGQSITSNGLVKHKWFALSHATIVTKYVNTTYMTILD